MSDVNEGIAGPDLGTLRLSPKFKRGKRVGGCGVECVAASVDAGLAFQVSA